MTVMLPSEEWQFTQCTFYDSGRAPYDDPVTGFCSGRHKREPNVFLHAVGPDTGGHIANASAIHVDVVPSEFRLDRFRIVQDDTQLMPFRPLGHDAAQGLDPDRVVRHMKMGMRTKTWTVFTS